MKITNNCVPGLEQTLSLTEGKVCITDKGYFKTKKATFYYTKIKKIEQKKRIYYIFDVDNSLCAFDGEFQVPYYNSLVITLSEGERTIYTWFVDKIERKLSIYGYYIKPLKNGNKVIPLDMTFFEGSTDIQSVQDWLEAHCTE